MRVRRFKVAGRLNGRSSATVSVTLDGPEPLIAVRPYRSRKTYEVTLAAVAGWIIYECVKRELRAKPKTKKSAKMTGLRRDVVDILATMDQPADPRNAAHALAELRRLARLTVQAEQCDECGRETTFGACVRCLGG